MKIGIDLGGTKTEIVVLDDAGDCVFRHRVPTPASNYNEILTTMSQLVALAEQTVACECSVGIATPGAISPASGLLRNSNTVVMNGKPLLTDLEEMLGRQISIANDANCFALSEAVDGAGSAYQTVFGVIVGTGTGAGVVVNKQVLLGANAIAGEWGHNPLPWPHSDELPGPECYCGKRGCIETWLAGPSFSRQYSQPGLLPPQIMDRYRQGEENARHAFKCYVDQMARAYAHVINILDPDVIVIGGGMGNITELYQQVPQVWGNYVFSDVVNTRLVPPKHGDSSGVRGAAWLWNDKKE